jgi:molecular chaperone Hsp33
VNVGDDEVLPFAIEGHDLRGRLARLGPLVDTVLNRHDYPEPVSRVLGEALALVALVGSALKFEGVFTLQTKSDGPIKMLVADFRAPGDLRGYAGIDSDRLLELTARTPAPSFRQLMGEGYLALTIDPGQEMERYQGIVALEGDSLADCADSYFRDSEQIPTQLRLAVARQTTRSADGPVTHWRAGGLLLQYLPRSGGADVDPMPAAGSVEGDAWAKARALMATVGDDELTDPTLPGDRLLYRLFHEDGVRAYKPLAVGFGCRCGPERVKNILSGFGREELSDLVIDGRIVAKCEFCSAEYAFAPDELEG